MIYTPEHIEEIVSQIRGTWVKRRNMRLKLTAASNAHVNAQIEAIRRNIRALKASGARQSELRRYFAQITELELKLLET